MNYLKILLLCCTLSACNLSQNADETARSKNIAKEYMQKMVFVKNEKSGLCFAHSWADGAYGGSVLTQVPCSEVEHLLEK